MVYPNSRGMNMLPPAIALFTAILRRQGHTVELFDSTDYLNPEEDGFDSDKEKVANLNAKPFDDTLLKESFRDENVFDSFERCVKEFQPGLITMSCTEDTFPLGLSLIKRITSLEIPTLLGGVFPTFASELVMSNPEVDMVCVGEGEYVISDLCNRMEKEKTYDDIPGLWIRKNGFVKRNAMMPPVDINKNPHLDLSIFPKSRLYRPMQGKMWRMFPLETHRGCPYTCSYCNAPAQRAKYKNETGGRFFRKKNIEKIREEIIHLRDKYNVEAFYFWADTFFAYSEREFDEFVEMYSEFKIPFWCQTRPETITEKRVKELADIGMFRMAFGIEHGNHEFRKRVINRSLSNEMIIASLKVVNKVGVNFSVNNILGLPYETRDLTFDTINLNRQIVSDDINAFSFCPFHGSQLRVLCEKEGYIEQGRIVRSYGKTTTLKMPQYPPEQIEGMRRCFVLYVKMSKDRWPEIEKAESLTPEGNKIWENLCNEIKEINYGPSHN